MSNGNLVSVTEYLEILPDFAARTTPTGRIFTNQANSDSNEEQLQLYRVEVRNQGRLVAEHTITASDALKAINLIEREYGELVQAEIVKVESGDGRQRRVLIPKNWRGYTFDARIVE